MASNADKSIRTILGAPEKVKEISEILLISIERNPLQHRLDFDLESVRELADDIKERGLLSPIIVRPNPRQDGRPYQIVAGERRYMAVELLGWKTIPAIIRNVADDKDMLSDSAAENILREDISIMEKANLVHMLLAERSDLSEVSRVLRLSTRHVERYLRIHREINSVPDFLEIFIKRVGKKDFATASEFAAIAPKILKLRKSNKREYYRILLRLEKLGVKAALPALQKQFAEKKDEAAKEQPSLRVATLNKTNSITFSAMWTMNKKVSREDLGGLKEAFENFLSVIEVDDSLDPNLRIPEKTA